MSDAGIDPLKPHHLPLKDASGVLTGSPLYASSSTFLSLTDDYPGNLITGIRVQGLTPENSNDGRLYAEIDFYENALVLRRFPRESEYWNEQEDLAAADLYPLGGDGGEVTLVATEYHPGVSGTVTLSSSDHAVCMELFIPMSSVEALVVSDEYHSISSLTISGVTPQNSHNGLFQWEIHGDSSGIHFTVSKPYGGSLVAIVTIPEDAYFPVELELEAANDSGVTGMVTLEGGGPSSGQALVRLYDQLHVSSGLVVPDFAGSTARPLYVDENGKIFPYSS